MDFKDLGSVVAEQMDALEESDYPEGTQIPAALTAVIIRLPDGTGTVRVRISLPENNPDIFSATLIKGILTQALEQGWL